MLDVLTIGTATRDVFLRSPLFKIVRDPKHLKKLGFRTGEAQCFALGGKVEVEQIYMTVGGGAANAAVTFARQGFKTGALVKIALDPNGEAVLQALRKEKVSPLTVVDWDTMTAYSVILLSPNGERTILHYRGASEDLRKSDIAFTHLKSKWAYIAPGHIPLQVIQAIVKRLKANKTKIALNPSSFYLKMGPARLKSLLRNVEVIIMNREEASAFTNVPYSDSKRIFKKFDELVPGLAVMTDGPRGVQVSDGRTIWSAGTFREKKIIDRTGAGDAFGSGFVSGLLRRKSADGLYSREAIIHAIRMGSANATSVVETVGAETGILKRHDFDQPRFKKLKIAAERSL